MTFKNSLENLKDYDIAYHDLACLLGLATNGDWIKYKPIYNSNNDVSDALYKIIQTLIEIEAVIYDEEELMIRWNNKFKLEKFNSKGYSVK